MKIKTNNLKEFNAIAVEFAKSLGGGTAKLAKVVCRVSDTRRAFVVGLYGDLGAGKTHFVKVVAKELGIKAKVNSPTFVIMKRYEIPDVGRLGILTSNVGNLVHIDAYRLKSEKEILNLGFKEIINNPENIVFIEWAENIKKALPKKYLKVKIKHLEGEKRELEF